MFGTKCSSGCEMSSELEIEPRFLDNKAIMDSMRRAVQRAVWEHKQLGYPIFALKDGTMQWIPPEEIEVERPQDE